jgi:hypothetical protein
MWQDGQVQAIFLLQKFLIKESLMLVLMVMLLSQSLMQTFLKENKSETPWEAFVPPF